MIVWKSNEELGELVRDVLSRIPEQEYKMRSQIDNAYNSIGSNFVEGYYAGYVGEFIRFLRYGRRSGAELYERVKQAHQKKIIGDRLFERFEDRSQKTNYLIDRTRQGLEKSRNKQA